MKSRERVNEEGGDFQKAKLEEKLSVKKSRERVELCVCVAMRGQGALNEAPFIDALLVTGCCPFTETDEQ